MSTVLIEPSESVIDIEHAKEEPVDDLHAICACEGQAMLLGYAKSRAISFYRQYIQELNVRNSLMPTREAASRESFESWFASTYCPTSEEKGYEGVRGVFFDDNDMVIHHPDLFGLQTCPNKYKELREKWASLIEETQRMLNNDPDIKKIHMPPIGLCEHFPDDEQDDYHFKLYVMLRAMC